MIQEKTYFTCKCDNCGDNYESEEITLGVDKDQFIQMMKGNNWLVEGDKHYCPDCYDYDDNDNIVICAVNFVECECPNCKRKIKVRKQPPGYTSDIVGFCEHCNHVIWK